MELLNCVKLFHWRTFSYAQHIATDTLYANLNLNIDKYVEVMLGKMNGGRVKNVEIHCHPIQTKEKFISQIHEYIDFLNNDSAMQTFNKEHSDLANIRDEIVADLNQLLYLFTFS